MRNLGRFALLCVGACASPVAPSSSTGSGSPTAASTSTSAAVSSSATSGSATSTSPEAADSSTEDGLDSLNFIDNEPTGRVVIECSVIDDTCPPGEKCNFYSNDGGSAWNAAKCFPEVERPGAVDAECTVVGDGASGLDSCERGSMCLYVDLNTGLGECVPFCRGTRSNPVCDDPYRECSITNGSPLLVCSPDCDPLDPETCAEREACYALDGRLRCRTDTSGPGGGPLSSCESANACELGSTCTAADRVGACPPDADNCCAPFCDLSDPECPDGTTCTPFFVEGTVPPGYEDLGLCGTDPR